MVFYSTVMIFKDKDTGGEGCDPTFHHRLSENSRWFKYGGRLGMERWFGA